MTLHPPRRPPLPDLPKAAPAMENVARLKEAAQRMADAERNAHPAADLLHALCVAQFADGAFTGPAPTGAQMRQVNQMLGAAIRALDDVSRALSRVTEEG